MICRTAGARRHSRGLPVPVLAAFLLLVQPLCSGPWACVAVKMDAAAAAEEDLADAEDDDDDDVDSVEEDEGTLNEGKAQIQAHKEVSQVLVQRQKAPAQASGIRQLEVELEQRQTRMEMLERAETESLLREQTALEALEREQTSLAKKEAELEATQKDYSQHVKVLSRKATPKPVSLVQELHNEWYHQRAASAEDNSTESITDANETSNGTAAAGGENVKEFPEKNKLLLQVINVFGLGFWGVDRCYMNQPWLGLLKAVTIGGLSTWAFIDWVVITVNALDSAETINTFGFQAQFTTGVQDAFWLAIFNLIFAVCVSCYQCWTAIALGVEQAQGTPKHGLPPDGELYPPGEDVGAPGKA